MPFSIWKTTENVWSLCTLFGYDSFSMPLIKFENIRLVTYDISTMHHGIDSNMSDELMTSLFAVKG